MMRQENSPEHLPAPLSAPPEEKTWTEAKLETLADAVCRRHAGALAIFLLESSKPLSTVFSQAMLAFSPLASIVVDEGKWDAFAHVLEDRQAIEHLIVKIEEKEQASSAAN